MKKYIVTVDGEKFEVIVQESELEAAFNAPVAEKAPEQAPEKEESAPVKQEQPQKAAPASGDGLKVTAPLPGTVLKINAKPGQSVKQGEILCILEAMKMENEIVAPEDCTVASVAVNEGSSVNTGDLLFLMA